MKSGHLWWVAGGAFAVFSSGAWLFQRGDDMAANDAPAREVREAEPVVGASKRPPLVAEVGMAVLGNELSAKDPSPQKLSKRSPIEAHRDYQAQYDAFLDEPPRNTWRGWDMVWQRGDAVELSLVAAALGESLRRQGSRDLYREISDRLYESWRSIEERLAIVGVMQYAATPEAVEVLLAYLEASATSAGDDPSSQQASAEVIKKARESIRLAASALRNDGGRNWSVSPVLEAAWQEMGQETPSADLATVAGGLAALGTAAGTTALVTAASGVEDPGSEKQQIARLGISHLESNDAVPVLKNALSNQLNDAGLRWVVIDGLISIGSADASRVLADYLEGQRDLDGDRLAQLEKRLYRRQFPDESIKVFKDALSFENFSDSRVADLLRSALETNPDQSQAPRIQ